MMTYCSSGTATKAILCLENTTEPHSLLYYLMKKLLIIDLRISAIAACWKPSLATKRWRKRVFIGWMERKYLCR